MRDGDCGCIPVVDENDKLAGMVTDRDVCVGLADHDVRASELAVRNVMASRVVGIGLDEDVERGIAMMRDQKIRRIPVTNRDGTIAGLLSLNDVVLATRDSKGDSESIKDEAFDALRSICEPCEAASALA